VTNVCHEVGWLYLGFRVGLFDCAVKRSLEALERLQQAVLDLPM
jgi:hypothetical protein